MLVPAHAIGHTVGERLALEAGSWANVRFRTPFDLALETAAPFLVERDINPIGDDLGAPLMMRLLRELPATVPSYFGHLAAHPTMGAALWSSMVELRLAGLSAHDLSPDAFENLGKHAELQALLAAYESWLVDSRRADAASTFTEALIHVAAIIGAGMRKMTAASTTAIRKPQKAETHTRFRRTSSTKKRVTTGSAETRVERGHQPRGS